MSFILLRTYDHYIAANLHLQQLEEEGIKCYLQDENTVTINPVWSQAMGGIKLMVYEEQSVRALEILADIDDQYKKSIACPKCGSHEIQSVTDLKKPSSWLTALSTWLLGSYAISTSEIYRCSSCGHEMKELPTPTFPE
ncbi:MAG: DUF2007 domain-containing protein [Chitinophagaceae bacterium]|nr:DUF2007 domain-containing protein [Chitinophagaceae bacterium]